MKNPAMDDLHELGAAVRASNATGQLPRCLHGLAMLDHGGNWLQMDCGCVFPRDWNHNPKRDVMRKALEGVLHHNDGVKEKYKLPHSLINQIREALK